MTIGKRIKDLREAKGWTPFQLSLESGVREANIRIYEGDERRSPNVEMLSRIAVALGTTTDFLISGLKPADVSR